jgi:hypothetical protein
MSMRMGFSPFSFVVLSGRYSLAVRDAFRQFPKFLGRRRKTRRSTTINEIQILLFGLTESRTVRDLGPAFNHDTKWLEVEKAPGRWEQHNPTEALSEKDTHFY